MDSPDSVVVLYSKYSPACRSVVDLYAKVSTDATYFRFVCIDNLQFRNKLLSSGMDIKTVPCVLLMYPFNRVEKFEHPTLSDWITEQLSKYLPTRTLVDMGDQSSSSQLSQGGVVQQPQQQYPQAPVSQGQVAMPSQSQPIQQSPTQEGATSIADLMGEDFSPSVQPVVSIAPVRAKSAADIAAEMVASREQYDKQFSQPKNPPRTTMGGQ